MMMMQTALAIVASYLLGSVPTGLIIGKVLRGVDVRDFGSGKTGAANSLRTLGIGPSAVVFLGDLLKGTIAVLLARYLTGDPWVEVAAGLGAAVGHNWPILAGFRGGRGVTTSFGSALALIPLPALICVPIFAGTIAISRYVSLGSIVAAVAVPLVTVPFVLTGQARVEYLFFGLIGAALIVFKHHDNIARLLAGQERKIGQKEDLNRQRLGVGKAE